MLTEFQEYIKQQMLFEPNQRVLLAVSGGIDSMVMVHLFATAGYDFGIAHCNFHLRGEESDGDALLVAQQAARYEVPFFTIDFDTKTYASTHKLTIQVAARDLRYNWFGQLLRSEGFDFVATAHHQGDSVETFFINLARGTGIRGLTSIRPKTGNVVRPLLFSTRKQIELYQQVEGVRYREDSSNASLKYVRNKIRHDIVPRFEDIFDNYSDAVVKNIDRLREIEMVYMSAIDTARASSLLASDTQTVISISKLKQLSPLRTYLFEFLKPFDFSAATVDDIILVLDRQPGRQFYSHSHRLIKNRDELIIVPLVEEAVASVLVNENQEQVEIKQDDNSSLRLRLSRIAKTDGYEISRDRNTATLDADNLSWPLELRRWNQGDFFYPFGMKGRKLVSDYFTDEKFSLLQKEQTWLLCSDSRVVWIVGHRTDNRFKVEAHTQDLLVLSVL